VRKGLLMGHGEARGAMEAAVNQVNCRLYCSDVVAAVTKDDAHCNSIGKRKGRAIAFIMHDFSLHKEGWNENLYSVIVCMHSYWTP
jgi:hypothetical protein